MKPLFYVMLRGINGPTLTPFTHEQDALRMAEAVLGCTAPYGPAQGSIEVGELVPTAGVVSNPGRYVDGIEFPYSIQCIEGDPAPDELVEARDLAGRYGRDLRKLRQGVRDLLATLGECSYMDNATITKRLTAPDLPGSPRLPRFRPPAPPPPDDDHVLIEKRRKAQEKRDRRAAKRRAAGGGR